jgi:transposase InsO family protein
MALDALGYRYGHTTVWQMVALYKQAHPHPPREPRVPNPAERPKATTAPHQAWFVALRYLVQIAGHWLYSVLIFDGYSRAIVGAGCFERQNFSRILHVFRQALTQGGAPEAVVSDHGAVCVALAPCLRQLDIQGAPTMKGHPWQNRAESGFAIQRRMLDAYVVGCTERSRCISGMPSLCGISSFGAIGRINARMRRAASIISPRRSYSGRRGGGRSTLCACGGPYASAS